MNLVCLMSSPPEPSCFKVLVDGSDVIHDLDPVWSLFLDQFVNILRRKNQSLYAIDSHRKVTLTRVEGIPSFSAASKSYGEVTFLILVIQLIVRDRKWNVSVEKGTESKTIIPG